MQRFIAELSKLIETAEFERAWQNDSAKNPNVTVAFAFAGRRVTITIDSLLSPPWRSDDFHRTFSSAIHRVDQHCKHPMVIAAGEGAAFDAGADVQPSAEDRIRLPEATAEGILWSPSHRRGGPTSGRAG